MSDKILVVDDEPDIHNLVKMILDAEGYQVLTASTAEEGVEKAKAEAPDLILLDLVMPGKSGLEACAALKGKENTKHIPVVAFTALGREVDRKLTSHAGADSHFTKPFAPEELKSEVRRILESTRSSKFAAHVGLEHSQLRGRKILLEFEPTSPYERLVRDFVIECASHGEKPIVLTHSGSTVQEAFRGDDIVEFMELDPATKFSPILNSHLGGPFALVCDSLTNVALSGEHAYRFAVNALQVLNGRVTALFLLNSTAHDARDVASLRALFGVQIAFGKNGASIVRLA